MAEITTYKVSVMGESCTGKTTYINYLLTRRILKKHHPTMGVEIHLIRVDTNYGKYHLNMWDHAGKETYLGFNGAYCIEGNGALIFSSSMDASEYNKWEKEYHRFAPEESPVVYVSTNGEINTSSEIGECVPLSVRDESTLYKPVESILRCMSRHEDLCVESIK
jgi:GTP-binding nuclear protein Ran